MAANPSNPTNSATLQALLDLQQTDLTPDARQNLEKLVKALRSTDGKALAKADKRFAAHQYPTAKLVYTRLSTVVKAYAMTFLSPRALQLLILMQSFISADSLVSVRSADYMTMMHLQNKGTYRNAVKELLEHGCIAIHTPATGHQPAVYMVNPYIALQGRGVAALLWRTFMNLAEPGAGYRFKEECATCGYTLSIMRGKNVEGDQYSYGTLLPITSNNESNVSDSSDLSDFVALITDEAVPAAPDDS